jgi:SAM-dependent methyltransferase
VIEPARSFDRAAEEYERTRPDYPPAILDYLPLRPDATVVDVGAGTGKLTRVLTRRYAQVCAVEPLDGMRGILERVVPEARALAGRAEAIPLPDASVDGAFAAQAFHWFANDEAIAEFARVLRPGGVFCSVWNSGDDSRPSPLPAAYLAYLDELRVQKSAFADSPSFDEVIRRGPFGELREEKGVPHDHVLDRAGLLANARTVSWIASRDAEDHAAVLARLGELLPEGTYAIPNLANVRWTTRV